MSRHPEAVVEARDALQAALDEIGGCGDGGCNVSRPKGMHTNGGCRCSDDRQKMRRVMGHVGYFLHQTKSGSGA